LWILQEAIKECCNVFLQLGVAILFWYEGAPEAPPVVFGSEKKYAAFHLIDMLWADPQAYLLVMAYRNFTSGAPHPGRWGADAARPGAAGQLGRAGLQAGPRAQPRRYNSDTNRLLDLLDSILAQK